MSGRSLASDALTVILRSKPQTAASEATSYLRCDLPELRPPRRPGSKVKAEGERDYRKRWLNVQGPGDLGYAGRGVGVAA